MNAATQIRVKVTHDAGVEFGYVNASELTNARNFVEVYFDDRTNYSMNKQQVEVIA